MRAVLLALCLVLAATVARAERVEAALEQAHDALTRASRALGAADTGQAQLTALGQAVRAHEDALSLYRVALRALAEREGVLLADIERNRESLAGVLSSLQTMSRAPRSALLAYPAGPIAATRAARLMANVSPALEAQIASLRGQLDRLRQVRGAQELSRVEIRGLLSGLQDLRARATAALAKREDALPVSARELARQGQAAAQLATTLGELAALLPGFAQSGHSNQIGFVGAQGRIPLPVRGTLSAGPGEPDPWGRVSEGIVLSAPAYSEVSAPWSGTIRFAGPLTDYGQIVVIEPESGVLMVLAGLGRIDRTTGDTVLRGERLGDLGGRIPDSREFLLEATTDRALIAGESLYIELRVQDQIVDPLDWFDFATKGQDG